MMLVGLNGGLIDSIGIPKLHDMSELHKVTWAKWGRLSYMGFPWATWANMGYKVLVGLHGVIWATLATWATWDNLCLSRLTSTLLSNTNKEHQK